MAYASFKAYNLVPYESEEQAQVMEWAAWCPYHRELKWLFHVPNGGERPGAVAKRLQLQGVKSGVSDLMLPLARGKYHGLWIELKRRDGGAVSQNQRDFIRDMIDAGYMATVARGSDEAIRIITDYLEERL